MTWLKYMMDELDIDVKEIASVTGKSTKQVERYRKDGFPHHKNGNEIKQKCFNYICQKSCFRTYHHIENRIFFRMFRDYFNALNSRPETQTTQKEMADFCGVEQKTISSWLNPDKKYTNFSAERQYQILNFLFSQSMKQMGTALFSLEIPDYLDDFDYLGYYAIRQELKHYLRYPKKFFCLMQNREILSEADKRMIDYTDMPQELYFLLMRQFEACLRYAKYLPGSQKQYQAHSVYEQLDFSMFFRIFQNSFSALRTKSEQNAIYIMQKPGSVHDRILQRHLKAVSNCQFLGTKQEQHDEIQLILDSFSAWDKKNYEQLYQKLIEIMQNFTPISERVPKRASLRAEQVTEQLRKLTDAEQDIILNHVPAFLDTINHDNQFIASFQCRSFKSTLFYPLLKKMLCTADKRRIIREMESEVFKHGVRIDYDEEGKMIFYNDYDKNYKSIKTMYRTVNHSLQIYLTMSKLKSPKKRHDAISLPTVCDPVEKYQAYEEYQKKKNNAFVNFTKNAKSLLAVFPETDILEILLDKLEFSPEDWYLWGLMQIGIRTNPGMTVQKMLDFLETPDEILKMTAKKQ